MRLLKDEGLGKLRFVEFQDSKIPRYAILSHTWLADGEEVTFKDIMEGVAHLKAKGYRKIDFCREQAANHGIDYFWVDTCCIDKSSSAELNTAINSMFRWYRNADICFVYLSDVSSSTNTTHQQSSELAKDVAFPDSRWFRRGWTLQELIAPASVDFYSREGERLGTKNTLEEDIHAITGIALNVLRGGNLSDFSIRERMSWAKHRETTHPEDKAYCLLGIFDVFLVPIYAEGETNAFVRLHEEIDKRFGEKSAAALLPSSTLRFRRDGDFVDRKGSHDGITLLEQIERQCAKAARVVLVGIGGAGKSQLAIEFCHRVREQSPDRWVFWVYASNIDRVEQGFREIAERLKIPGHRDPKENILELVARWLRDESKGKWVLVVDNLDNEGLLSASQVVTSEAQAGGDAQRRRPLSAYLPQSLNGMILITTRARSVATELADFSDIIKVGPMTDTDAIELLSKKLDGEREQKEQDLKDLARTLEYIPLAVVQAAAYIQQKGGRYSARQYIDEFQRNEKKKKNLLSYGAGQARRDEEAENSTMITWQISFNDIRERWPVAADLLSLMCYFDRQGIPKEVLTIERREGEIEGTMRHQKKGVGEDESNNDHGISDDSMSQASDDDVFDEAIERLRSYSFVSVSENQSTFEMHGLVQLAMRNWLEIQGEAERWKGQYYQKLNMALPHGSYENWLRCEELFPHVKSAEKQRPHEHQSILEWAEILQKGGRYMLAKGSYTTAERMCELSTRALYKLLGEDDVETSYSQVLLARIYVQQGRWTEAEKIFIQATKTMGRSLGEEHPNTLSCVDNLALTYWNQGRWTEAEEIGVQVVEKSRRMLGEEHPTTLVGMANLAMTYWNQGRWTEAEEIGVQVVEISRRVLGEEHPNTLAWIANLATTYWNQGRWTEAEEIEVQVVEISRRVLGVEHPDTLTRIANLAMTYWNQGRWTEAEERGVQVVEISRRVLGEEHPDTLNRIANLAFTYKNQGQWREAEEIEVQVLEKTRRVLGEEHPLTLACMNNLAFTMKGQGRKMEAIKLMMECVRLSNQVLGPEHHQALSSAETLTDWQSEG